MYVEVSGNGAAVVRLLDVTHFKEIRTKSYWYRCWGQNESAHLVWFMRAIWEARILCIVIGYREEVNVSLFRVRRRCAGDLF